MEIELTQGYMSIVDNEDYERVNKFNWHVNARGYATTSTPAYALMHRYILGVDSLGKDVDHINGDRLDNRKENLRVVNNSQNARNRKKVANTTSRYKGVSWLTRHSKWTSRITLHGKSTFLGYFDSEEEAARAYDKSAKDLFGEYARLNFTDLGVIEISNDFQQRFNLSQGKYNQRKQKNTSSKYKGVTWLKKYCKWQSQIQKNGKHYYLGVFETESEAALAYNKVAKELFGEYARLNEIYEVES
ncbi:HNH endonuclease [Salicibibacter kimchii]|uniref:AP2/ERF domain-containing protein n=1 Tax=Salicibibacter kimchii TaxID=2099786 RepID=A0A345BUF9_9BACI|nr:AP2 domain-containing protein [Salicibibacter kimchii]AXF54590.1 hypothetical protein DT065_00205 [Salicibibacter kimchii]